MINRVKYKIRKLFLNNADEAFGDKKTFASTKSDCERGMVVWHLPMEKNREYDLRRFSLSPGSISGKRYRYFPSRENCSTSGLSPVVLAYMHLDGELLKDLGLDYCQ